MRRVFDACFSLTIYAHITLSHTSYTQMKIALAVLYIAPALLVAVLSSPFINSQLELGMWPYLPTVFIFVFSSGLVLRFTWQVSRTVAPGVSELKLLYPSPSTDETEQSFLVCQCHPFIPREGENIRDSIERWALRTHSIENTFYRKHSLYLQVAECLVTGVCCVLQHLFVCVCVCSLIASVCHARARSLPPSLIVSIKRW